MCVVSRTNGQVPTDPPLSSSPLPDTRSTNSLNCGLTHIANETAQYIYSPNYPYLYPNDLTCTYLITGPADLVVSVGFTYMSLEYSYYCSYDKITIYDGPDTTYPLLGTYCGTTYPPFTIASSNYLYIVFESDYSVSDYGADFYYQTYNNSYPLCKSGYTVYTATTTIQTLSNNDYPNTYGSNIDEYYLLENLNTGTYLLIIELVYSSIERGTNCAYDRLTIYNGVGGTAPPTTTTTTLGPPVTAEIGLINNVLTNYSSENLPARNLSIPIESVVDVALVGINGLDEVQQKLTTTIQFYIKWTDSNINWPVSKLSGITQLLIPQNDVWKPDIALLNSFTQITQLGSKFMFVVINNEGLCTWKPYQILESTCSVDMTNYPYDTQTCELQISTWSSSSDQVNTTVGANGMAKHEGFVENAEWHLLEISHRTATINGQTTAIFSLKLKRNPSFIVTYITIPVVLLSFLNAVTFALPVASGEKASFSITVFLSFVVYVIVTFDKMPESSDSISLFAMYILIMTCVSAFTLMISVLELRMMTLSIKHKPVTRCTIAFTKFILTLQTKMLCISKQLERKKRLEEIEEIERLHRRNPKTRRSDADDDEDEDDENEAPEETAWTEFVSALDFVCFWIFIFATLAISLGFLIHLSLQ
ncbi:hypothetical protein ACF0H5_011713 [Mactra antiquata]